MLRELKQIFPQDISASFCSEKKLQKCVSATDISRVKPKKLERTCQFTQCLLQEQKVQRTKQLDEFLFCLKLKMISIAGIFGDTQFNSQKIQTRDANQILNQLSKKIKSFQKDMAKRVNQEIHNNKSLEIKIINLQSYIKSLESQQSHSKKQIERNLKAHTIDVKKMENKLKQHQSEKQIAEMKLSTTTQIVDEQAKYIAQLEAKAAELQKNKVSLQKDLFQKEKTIVKLISDQKVLETQHDRECQGLKKSIMKKTEESNKLISEVTALKETIEARESKIEEMRKRCNKLYFQVQQLESKLNHLTADHNELNSNKQKIEEEYKLTINRLKEKQTFLTQSISHLEQTLNTKLQSLKSIGQQIHKVRMQQHQIHTDVDRLSVEVNRICEGLEQRIANQEQLHREELEVETRNVIMDVERYYQQHLMRLEDQIFVLKCQQKGQ